MKTTSDACPIDLTVTRFWDELYLSTGVTMEAFFGSRRLPHVCRARHLAARALQSSGLSLSEIAVQIRRDRKTVLYALTQTCTNMVSDSEKETLSRLHKALGDVLPGAPRFAGPATVAPARQIDTAIRMRLKQATVLNACHTLRNVPAEEQYAIAVRLACDTPPSDIIAEPGATWYGAVGIVAAVKTRFARWIDEYACAPCAKRREMFDTFRREAAR